LEKEELMKTKKKWTISYYNDTGYPDGMLGCWTVTNGEKSFKCDSAEEANWLRDFLTVNGA